MEIGKRRIVGREVYFVCGGERFSLTQRASAWVGVKMRSMSSTGREVVAREFVFGGSA